MKSVISFLLGIVAVLSFIWGKRAKDDVKSTVEDLNANKKVLEETVNEVKQSEQVASDSVSEYERVRDEFLRGDVSGRDKGV